MQKAETEQEKDKKVPDENGGGAGGKVLDDKKKVPTKDAAPEVVNLDTLFADLLSEVSTKKKLKAEEKEHFLSIASALLGHLESEMADRDGDHTKRMIQTGKTLNLAKRRLVKKEKGGWTEWADASVPFIKERLRQMYMNVARYEDALDFAFLGSRRIISLASKVKAAKSSSIRVFLEGKEMIVPANPSVSAASIRDSVDLLLQKRKPNGASPQETPKAKVDKINAKIASLEKFITNSVANDSELNQLLNEQQQGTVSVLTGKVGELKTICDSMITLLNPLTD
jgi:hypothetical protein